MNKSTQAKTFSLVYRGQPAGALRLLDGPRIEIEGAPLSVETILLNAWDQIKNKGILQSGDVAYGKPQPVEDRFLFVEFWKEASRQGVELKPKDLDGDQSLLLR
jgi:hypothetical protein